MKNKFFVYNLNKNSDFFAKFNLFLLLFCSFIGVGFVSGAEIYEFFVKYKSGCIFGLIVFFILVFVIIYKMLCLSKLNNTQLKSFTSNNKLKNNNLKNEKYIHYNAIKNKIRESVFGLNVFVVASAMFSGLNYFLSQIFENNYIKFYFLCLFFVFIILHFGVKYLQIFDYIVITFILYLIVYFLVENNNNFTINFIDFSLKDSILSMLFSSLYVFMNLFQLKPLIDLNKSNFKDKKNCIIFSFTFTFSLLLVLIVFVIVLQKNNYLCDAQMPFLEFFKTKESIFKLIFCLGLVISILSTQISSLIGFKEKLSKKLKLNNFYLSLITFILCYLFSFLPFKIFVSYFYPILGAINLIIFVFC